MSYGRIEFDPQWVAKYDRPGPRYTSYPTAPNFYELTPDVAEEIYRASNHTASPLSFYIHLPYCKSVCYFCACNVIYTKDRDRGARYVDLLLKEIALLEPLISPSRPLVQVHLGGGTPTFLYPRDLDRLLERLFCLYPPAPDAEISVELDPRETTPSHLEVLLKHGFNRISIGVQDTNPLVQRAINRLQPMELTRTLVESLRSSGKIKSINFDLIYGLPYQTQETFLETLQAVCNMRPDRIALFNFGYVPWAKPHQRRIETRAMPEPREKLAILTLAVELLKTQGYCYIGMDHFALPGDELLSAQRERTLHRNFQGYTTRKGCDLIGIGITSIGEVLGNYLQNLKEEKEYQNRIEAGILPVSRGFLLSFEDHLRKAVIMDLMCHYRVLFSEIEKRFGIPFRSYFTREIADLKPFVENDLVEVTEDAIEVKPAGRFVIRNIAMVFDAYLRENSLSRPIFSRTV
jgi:oxygen-independent coproporphyrinogen-3 oxidase